MAEDIEAASHDGEPEPPTSEPREKTAEEIVAEILRSLCPNGRIPSSDDDNDSPANEDDQAENEDGAPLGKDAETSKSKGSRRKKKKKRKKADDDERRKWKHTIMKEERGKDLKRRQAGIIDGYRDGYGEGKASKQHDQATIHDDRANRLYSPGRDGRGRSEGSLEDHDVRGGHDGETSDRLDLPLDEKKHVDWKGSSTRRDQRRSKGELDDKRSTGLADRCRNEGKVVDKRKKRGERDRDLKKRKKADKGAEGAKRSRKALETKKVVEGHIVSVDTTAPGDDKEEKESDTANTSQAPDKESLSDGEIAKDTRLSPDLAVTAEGGTTGEWKDNPDSEDVWQEVTEKHPETKGASKHSGDRKKSREKTGAKDADKKDKKRSSFSSTSRSKKSSSHRRSSRSRSRARSRKERSSSNNRNGHGRRRSSRRERSRDRRRRRRSRSGSHSRRDRHSTKTADKTTSSRSERNVVDEEEEGFKINKEKLLLKAKENVRRMMKEQNLTIFQAAKKQIGLMAEGRSVEELTEFCRHIVENEESDDGELGVTDESKTSIRTVVHPFQVKERPLLILNIKNATQLPTVTHQERTKAALEERRLQFPVSSGQDHRKVEDEMDIEEESPEPPVALEAKSMAVVPLGSQPAPTTSATKFPVFDIPLPGKPLPDLIGQRMQAMNRLNNNPSDIEAISLMYEAEEKIGAWAKSQQRPGQFTGSTGVKPLTYEELSRGPQAWVKRDQLHHAAPVREGVGKALLERMGWREGEGLGKSKAGPLEPLSLDIKTDKRGLGNEPKRKSQPLCSVTPTVRASNASVRKPMDFNGKHPVSILMEMCSKNRWDPPIWDTKEEGPPHQRVFMTSVTVKGETYASDYYVNNKKQSKMEAAMACLKRWGLVGLVIPSPSGSSSESETNMPNSNGSNRPSMKPRGRAIEQQRLPAWQPILTAGTVLPTFFVIGIAFIPIGVGLLYFSNGVKHYELDYTFCKTDASTSCAEVIANNPGASCSCKLNFTIGEEWKGKVYVYYGLTNFYQNHRRYVKSRDDFQLLGDVTKKPDQECRPFAYVSKTATDKYPIVPCGAVANSMFNDTFLLEFIEPSKGARKVDFQKTGLAWESDKRVKFANPSNFNSSFPGAAFVGTEKPINWQKPVYELGGGKAGNQGLVNEDLIVWMRNAAFPNFRKLYAIVDTEQDFFRNGFALGKYELTVNYNFPVTQFDGTKRFMISTTSLLGGKNPFLGIAYIVVGCLFLVTGIVFIFVHIKYGKTTQEMISVTPQTPY